MTFIDLLQTKGIAIAPPGHRHYTNKYLNFDCPYCGPETHKYHMGYNLRHGYMNCWVCGKHPVAAVLTELGFTKTEISAVTATLKYVQQTTEQPRVRTVTLPDGLGPLMQCHRKYLTNRGFQPDKIEELWGIRGFGIARSGLSHRIFIPNYRHSQLISWQARSVADKGLSRYLSCSGLEEAFPSKDWLYGLDYVRYGIIVCEGPTDVWRVGPGAVATTGVGVSTAQIALMARYPVRAICFDSDSAGQLRAMDLFQTLSVYPGTTSNVMLDAADPGSAKEAEIRNLRRKFLD